MLTLLARVVFAATASDALLHELDAQESINERVEQALDATCAALKRGEPPFGLPETGLVQVTACSMRALELTTRDEVAARRLYWELDGRTQTGARRTLRGEGAARFARGPKGELTLQALEL